MAYIITDTCTKDELCVEACPTDCIHPKKDEETFEAATQLYVDPEGCIDCGACVPVCPTNSMFIVDEVPADKQEFIEKNAAHYAEGESRFVGFGPRRWARARTAKASGCAIGWLNRGPFAGLSFSGAVRRRDGERHIERTADIL